MKTLSDRFVEGYEIQGECWIWKRSKDKNGYGYIKKDKRTHKAHRISYELHNGPVGNLWVLHSCDNPSCVNPQHLWLGTAQDNNDDMMKKNRQKHVGWEAIGEKNPNAKLTQEDVDWIRANYTRGKGPEFSQRFGVGVYQITKIVRGEAWK